METLLHDCLRALADGHPLPVEMGALDPDLRDVLARIQQRVDGEKARHHELEAGVRDIHRALVSLAALDFGVQLEPTRTNPRLNAAYVSINMLGEELGVALQTAERARREAVAANRTKTVFLANMSHELRTPLNAIIGYGEMVLEEVRDTEGAPEHWEDDLTRVLDAARHLLRLISDILDLSKIEAGHMTFEVEPVCPLQVLDEVANAVKPVIVANRSVLTTVSRTERPVLADRLRLVQVLMNVASNAAKFTRDGRVEIAVETVGNQVVFTVDDTGTGIAAEHLESLFQPFVQVHSDPRAGSGTGLGLSIARELCRRMRGDIRVESELGRGSCFPVALPAA
ncbi:MAG: HAMP domain-containing sensor histidine kinase [Myxococcota bacterium]